MEREIVRDISEVHIIQMEGNIGEVRKMERVRVTVVMRNGVTDWIRAECVY